MDELTLIGTHTHLDKIVDLSRALHDAKASGVRGVAAVKRTPLERILLETDAPVSLTKERKQGQGMCGSR